MPKYFTLRPKKPLTTADHVIISLSFGLWGAFISFFAMFSAPHHVAKDFTWPWRAARALLDGIDPYHAIQATGPYPYNVGLFYPLPAAMIVAPVAHLPPYVAGAVFMGIASTLLAWGLVRHAPHQLPLFCSASFCQAALLGQWSPLLAAAALLPSLQWVCAAKPTVGLAAWMYRPTWRGVIGGALIVALSLLIIPSWPFEWREALRSTAKYRGPATMLVGCWLLLAALRWRRREGRLMLTMALVPQLPLFYDQLLLWLIPNTLGRSFLLSAISWVGYFQWYPYRLETYQSAAARPWLLATVYLPALVMLLLLPSRPDPVAAPEGQRADPPEPGDDAGRRPAAIANSES